MPEEIKDYKKLLPERVVQNVDSATHIAVELTHPGQLPFMYSWCKKHMTGSWGVTPIKQYSRPIQARQIAFVFNKAAQAQHFQNQVYLLDRRISPAEVVEMNKWSYRLLGNIDVSEGSTVKRLSVEKWLDSSQGYFSRSISNYDVSNPNIVRNVLDFCLENFEFNSWGLAMVFAPNSKSYQEQIALVFDNQVDFNYFSLMFDVTCLNHTS